jgi:hypothetical protein
MSAQKVWTGACHCGTVRFTVTLVDGLDKPRRCNCSLCRMRGAVVVSARVGDLTIESGADALQLYRFNTMQAEHYFCSRCGIYTHHKRRSNPNQLGVNVASFAGSVRSISRPCLCMRVSGIPVMRSAALVPR